MQAHAHVHAYLSYLVHSYTCADSSTLSKQASKQTDTHAPVHEHAPAEAPALVSRHDAVVACRANCRWFLVSLDGDLLVYRYLRPLFLGDGNCSATWSKRGLQSDVCRELLAVWRVARPAFKLTERICRMVLSTGRRTLCMPKRNQSRLCSFPNLNAQGQHIHGSGHKDG